jgi:mitogen-activated protein kinase kinase kinase 5
MKIPLKVIASEDYFFVVYLSFSRNFENKFFFSILLEHHLVTTDSMSNISDISGQTQILKPSKTSVQKEVCLIIDLTDNLEHYQQRKLAYEEVKLACQSVAANLHVLQFEKLDFGDTNTSELFNNADVLIVDLSIVNQQSALCYYLGVRESFEMKNNIVLYNDQDQEATLRMKISCENYIFLPYRQSENSCIITNPVKKGSEDNTEGSKKQTLLQRIKKILLDVEIQSKAYMKEKFLADLRAAREVQDIDEKKTILRNMRKRLDDPNVLSGELFQSYMYSLRDIQDYDSMVSLVDYVQSVPCAQKAINSGQMAYLYAFALNRRNEEGDREKALKSCVKALEKRKNQFPDMLCLCGRIYKDKFQESGYTDQDSLQQAIHWYRKSFEVQPNEYAGINLATLLVIKGDKLRSSQELQHIAITLNSFIGRRGELSSLKDYWHVATFFEISVLAEDYGKAIQAAECMFKLTPPLWYLKSTIGNIRLINQFRKENEDEPIHAERKVFEFWMEFFCEAIKTEDNTDIRFPILIFEPHHNKSSSNVYMPSYVTVNLDDEEKSIQIFNICVHHETYHGNPEKNPCRKRHDFLFTVNQIKSVSLYKRDDRCAYLYVHQNSDDFQIFFPSALVRQRFYDFVLKMTAEQGDNFVDLTLATNEDIKFDYVFNDNNERVVLGKGTYGMFEKDHKLFILHILKQFFLPF